MIEKKIVNVNILKKHCTDFPDKIAVKDKSNQFTYKQIYYRTLNIMHCLKKLKIGVYDRVGIYMENCSDYIPCILAVISIGAIFVPIGNNSPIERINKIVNNCCPKAILTNSNNIEKILEVDNVLVYNIDLLDMRNSSIKGVSIYENKLSDIAYIIYTSGSTGEPKGVAIRWDGLCNFLDDTIKRLQFDQHLISLNLTPFCFDGALTSIFCVVICGGTLIIENPIFLKTAKFAKILKDNNITDIGCPPIQLKMLSEALLSDEINVFCLKTIAIGGESFSAKYIKIF